MLVQVLAGCESRVLLVAVNGEGHEADADHRSGRLPGMFQRISIEG